MNYLIAHIGHTQRHNEHVCWWKPDSNGYTICIDKAGRYNEAEATSICYTGECIAVPEHKVEPLARSTPYYRMSSGKLGKLYDGGPHRPVDNESQAWRHLLSNRLQCSKQTEKPTPMPSSKARAIYLDATTDHFKAEAAHDRDERYLRRLLAVRVGMPHTYYDDGEAQGQEHGISIDFMREPVADIDAKLRALNVARDECAKRAKIGNAGGAKDWDRW